MMPRLTIPMDKQKELEDQLFHFACTGLRTLVMGQKKINKKTFDDWMKRYQEVNVSSDLDKDDKLLALYDELEWKLDYVGASAIEDLLQD